MFKLNLSSIKDIEIHKILKLIFDIIHIISITTTRIMSSPTENTQIGFQSKTVEICCDAGSIFIGDPCYINMIKEQVGEDGCFEDYKHKLNVSNAVNSDACSVDLLTTKDVYCGIGVLLGNANGNNIPIKIVKRYTTDEKEPLGAEITINIVEFKYKLEKD